MGMHWSGMTADPGFVAALQVGEKFAEDDEEGVEQTCVIFYSFEDAFSIEGTKAQLVQLLEQALQQARELPDDAEESAKDDGLDESEICRTEGCGESLEDNEGWDGYCGNCADRIERERGDE